MSNICNCPTPPGGQVVCEPHQMAICIVYNGQARQQCLDPIRTDSSTALVNWAISQITREGKDSDEQITNQEITFLTNGRYRTSNANITFSLPTNIKRALAAIINQRRGGNDSGQGFQSSPY